MMIQLHNAGKRYNRDWVFRNLTYTFQTGAYAITGPNGSGKSTLLQILSGAVTVNEGRCSHVFNDEAVTPDKVFNYTALCAPYIELVEEFTLEEFLSFHQSFKPFLTGLSIHFIIKEIQLEHTEHKKISEYSSGMKQRVKLAQCIFSNAPVVLLDEPCTNLDAAGIAMYQELVAQYCANRLVIVSSNDKAEYGFCNNMLDITAYK
ncbi:ABC transporter ATP-binding protein [Niabella aquatica]